MWWMVVVVMGGGGGGRGGLRVKREFVMEWMNMFKQVLTFCIYTRHHSKFFDRVSTCETYMKECITQILLNILPACSVFIYLRHSMFMYESVFMYVLQ